MAKRRKRFYVGETYFLEPPTLAQIIDCRFGPYAKFALPVNPPRPRGPKPHGYWKRNSWRILRELLHDVAEYEWNLWFRNPSDKLLPLSREQLWILWETSQCLGRSKKFQIAMLKDLGLYPAPKWHRVRMRLLNKGKK